MTVMTHVDVAEVMLLFGAVALTVEQAAAAVAPDYAAPRPSGPSVTRTTQMPPRRPPPPRGGRGAVQRRDQLAQYPRSRSSRRYSARSSAPAHQQTHTTSAR